MKKINFYLVASMMLFFVIPFSSWSQTFRTPLNTLKINPSAKAKTYTTIYAKNYFNVCYMNVGSLIAGYALDPIIENEEEKKSRLNSNEFEKKLGDFAVFANFFKALENVQDSILYFQLESTFDKNEKSRILKRLANKDINGLDKSFTDTLTKSNYKYVSAISIQYGIGARVGNEQLGLTKTYRPFISLLSCIKDVNTNETVWSNRIIVFSESSYKGRDNANNADPKMLIEQFEDLCVKLARFYKDDLNGFRYSSKDKMVDDVVGYRF